MGDVNCPLRCVVCVSVNSAANQSDLASDSDGSDLEDLENENVSIFFTND